MAVRADLVKSVTEQLKAINHTLEQLAKKSYGPKVPDRRASAGPLRATRHGSPADIASALGLADDEAARERLAHLLIQASGASRPRFARPVSPGLRPSVGKMSEAEQNAAVVEMIGSALRSRPEQVMRAPRRTPEQLAKTAEAVKPLTREERESVAVELIRQALSRRR